MLEPKHYWLKYTSQDLWFYYLIFMWEFNSSQIFLHAACSWLCTLQQRVIFGRFCLACVCIVNCASCDPKRFSRCSHLFKLLPVTRSRVRVIRIWKKETLKSEKKIWNLLHTPNWTSCRSYFLAIILSRHIFKNITVKWEKIVCSTNIW